jgi:hypothetical protein
MMIKQKAQRFENHSVIHLIFEYFERDAVAQRYFVFTLKG